MLMAASRRREAVHRPGGHLAAGRSQEHADHPVSIRHGEALPARQRQRYARCRSYAARRAWSLLLAVSPRLVLAPHHLAPLRTGLPPPGGDARELPGHAARPSSVAKRRRLAAAVHPEAVRARATSPVMTRAANTRRQEYIAGSH